MARIVGWIAIATLLVIAALHVYWAAGGIRGATAAVPAREGQPLFRPTRAATLLVALLLVLGAATLAARLGLLGPAGPDWAARAGAWTLAAAFLARAIGDFRWIGFFKRHTGTPFAALDSALYSPLCLGIAAACALVAIGGPGE
ncbi:MAG: DUF3995 domain-containing protein [Myxococcales bacterium]